jgi:hypothetical protein
MRRQIMHQYEAGMYAQLAESAAEAYPLLTTAATIFGQPIKSKYVGCRATPALMEEIRREAAREDARQNITAPTLERREIRDSTGAVVSIAMVRSLPPPSSGGNLFSEAEKALIDSHNKLMEQLRDEVEKEPAKPSLIRRLRNYLFFRDA